MVWISICRLKGVDWALGVLWSGIGCQAAQAGLLRKARLVFGCELGESKSGAADGGGDELEVGFVAGAEEVEVAAFVGLEDVVDEEAGVASEVAGCGRRPGGAAF